jgi:hypothetical protein
VAEVKRRELELKVKDLGDLYAERWLGFASDLESEIKLVRGEVKGLKAQLEELRQYVCSTTGHDFCSHGDYLQRFETCMRCGLQQPRVGGK